VLYIHIHHWLCYLGNTRFTATQFWCARSVITSVIQSGFVLQSFILHSYFTFFLPAFFHLSIYILPRNSQVSYQDLFNFDGGGNRSARRKPLVLDPRRKSLLDGATYLVPRAGIEPTPRTDIGYRPVSQTRQMREPLGHHVHSQNIQNHMQHAVILR
jgi:hypothetical protein